MKTFLVFFFNKKQKTNQGKKKLHGHQKEGELWLQYIKKKISPLCYLLAVWVAVGSLIYSLVFRYGCGFSCSHSFIWLRLVPAMCCWGLLRDWAGSSGLHQSDAEIIESQNNRGWERSLVITESNPLAKARFPIIACMRKCPSEFWLSPEKTTPQPL